MSETFTSPEQRHESSADMLRRTREVLRKISEEEREDETVEESEAE